MIQVFWTPKIGRVRAGVEVAFKRYGNQDVESPVPLKFNSSPPEKWLVAKASQPFSKSHLAALLDAPTTLRFPPFVSAAVALVQRHTDNETLGWWLVPLHLSTHQTWKFTIHNVVFSCSFLSSLLFLFTRGQSNVIKYGRRVVVSSFHMFSCPSFRLLLLDRLLRCCMM